MTQTPSGLLRRRWLDELLPDVPFEGWTQAAADAAAARAGLSQGERALAAPNGVVDLIEGFFDDADARARDALAEVDMSALRVPERVKSGILAWLDALEPNREAVRRAASRGFLPWGAGPALQRTWKVADLIWTAAGDQSDDYNRYSKRGLLAAVLPSIVLHWADHPAPEDLDAFIARRLSTVSGIGQKAGRIVKPVLERFGKR
jgi:ubiquinone biosynthesis protein COQ9